LDADVIFPVSAVPADINDARTLAARVRLGDDYSALPGRRNVTAGYEPFRLEGMKTVAFEIAEQLDGHWPSAIVYPCATGVGLAALWKAVLDADETRLASGPKPKLIGVQAAGCAPLVRAFERGQSDAEAWQAPRSVSLELRVPRPSAAEPALRAARASGGTILSVTDTEILGAVEIVGSRCGVLLGLEGGACAAAVRHAKMKGLLDPNAAVVLVNTMGGRKSNGLAARLPRLSGEQDKLGGLITPR
jgi:threonine synthase